MIDLHSVVTFFHKAKWTERAITHEINRVLAEDTISYSRLGKYIRMFLLSIKETDTPIVPESEGNFSLDDHIALLPQMSHFIQSPNCEEGDDLEINRGLSFNAGHEMEHAAF
jgi:hypothetical protein